ncbi:MAG: helix-turn-helix domain-containing protein [Fimbriimonadaceae bacterium]|nr:helix-turn-helix domain-containing protein [Fimbriimonadaceae bacterium]
MSSELKRLAYMVEEAAGLLSLSRAQVYRLLDVGEIDSVKIGRSRRITHGQLVEFIEALEARSSVTVLRGRKRSGAKTKRA